MVTVVGGRTSPGRPNRLVTDIADGADQRLVLGPELCAQPAHMHVDGAGAAEEVITPNLLQQLSSGEYPAGVLSQVLQQFELFVGEVERTAAQPRGVGALIDHQLAEIDFADALLVGRPATPPYQQSQPGVDLGGSGAGKQDLVDTPIDRDGNQPAFVDHGHHGAGRAQQSAQAPRRSEIGARIDDGDVGRTGLQKRGDLSGSSAHRVRKQRQRWQYRLRVRIGGQ